MFDAADRLFAATGQCQPVFDVTVRIFPGPSHTLQTNATLSTFAGMAGTYFAATNFGHLRQLQFTPGLKFLRARRN